MSRAWSAIPDTSCIICEANPEENTQARSDPSGGIFKKKECASVCFALVYLAGLRGESQRNSRLVERSRSGLFTWSRRAAWNEAQLIAELSRYPRKEARKPAEITGWNLTRYRIALLVSGSADLSSSDRWRRIARSRVHRAILVISSALLRLPRGTGYYFDLPAHSMTRLLPAFCFLARTKSLEWSVDEVISKEKKRWRSSRQPCLFAIFSPTVLASLVILFDSLSRSMKPRQMVDGRERATLCRG